MVSLGFANVKENQKKIDSIYNRINRLNEIVSG